VNQSSLGTRDRRRTQGGFEHQGRQSHFNICQCSNPNEIGNSFQMHDLHEGCICNDELLLCPCGCGTQIAHRAKFVDGEFIGVLPFTQEEWDRLSERLVANRHK
jgi:hypothetical protein